MSLGSVLQLKELSQTFQPLWLCEFTFNDGTVYRASTHALSLRYGGNAAFEFGGNEWEPRITSQVVGATQAMSDIGVDVPPNVQIVLADPDTTLRTTLEVPKGFKGAILKVYQVMFDAGNTQAGTFSGDSPTMVKFIGTCDAPEWDQGQMVVSARSLLNIAQTMMPPMRIQQLCSWTFPTNRPDRVVGQADPRSLFGRCGYSPDLIGGVGNFETGTACFTSCNYTRPACQARLGNDGGSLNPPPSIGISQISRNGSNVATVTISSIISLTVGEVVVVAGVTTDVTLNGTYSLLSVVYPLLAGETVVTYASIGSAVSISGQGTLSLPGSVPSGGSGISQLDKDHSGRDTGRFGGYTYVPNSSSGLQRSYTTGNWTEITNATTTAKYGDFGPVCYGTTWVVPKIMGIFGDGNYSNYEVLVNTGEVDRIHKVLVNGYEVPFLNGNYARPIAADSGTGTFINGFWVPINNGFRNGLSDGLPGWGNLGDPYGSVTAIYIKVLVEVATTNTLPEIQILLDGSHVRQYNGLTTFTTSFSRNPAWILMDVLTFCGWRYEDFDVGSWINAARICDQNIYFNSMSGFYQNYLNEAGNPPYVRYSTGFSIMARTSVVDVIRGLRNCMRGVLYFDYYTGKLTLVSKQSIASQQPYPIPGSNYNTPVTSTTVEGASGQGYLGYLFDGSNIAKVGGRSTLSVSQLKNQEAPNKISEVFQNRENTYNQDSCVVVDTEDSSRMGGYPISGTFPLLGAQTFDHVRRMVFGYMAECNRGNLRLNSSGSHTGDSGGSMTFNFKTSIKGVHLTIGMICGLTDEQSQGLISALPVRVVRIKPDTNFEMAEVSAAAHNDAWYQDTFGQENAPVYGPLTNTADRAPFAWQPGVLQANPADAWYGQDQTFFDVVPTYIDSVGDQPYAYLDISGIPPVNVFDPTLKRPRIASPGTRVAGSPAWPAGTYFMGVAQYKAGTSGALSVSPLSQLAGVAAATSGALSVVVQDWPATGASGHVACVGRNLGNPWWSDTTASVQLGTPTLSVVAPSFLDDLHCPPPDEVFANFRWRVQEEPWPGILRTTMDAVSYALDGSGTASVSLSITGSVSPGAWVGRVLSFVGTNSDNVSASVSTGFVPRIPVANLTITSNDAVGNVTVAGNPVNNGMRFAAGDAVVVRFAPTFGQDSIGPYFEDLLAVSPNNPSGFGNNALPGAQVFVVAGTGQGTYATVTVNTPTRCYVQGWTVPPDSTTQVVVLMPTLRVDQKSNPVFNAVLNLQDVAALPNYLVDVTTLQHKMLFVQAFTEAAGGVLSPAVLSPFRELYVFDGSVDGVLVNGVGGPGNFG